MPAPNTACRSAASTRQPNAAAARAFGSKERPDVTEFVGFRKIDVLEINANNSTIVHDILLEDIRVDHMAEGKLFNFAVTGDDPAAPLSARRLPPLLDGDWRSGDPASKLKVDPREQNFASVRLWGGETHQNKLTPYCARPGPHAGSTPPVPPPCTPRAWRSVKRDRGYPATPPVRCCPTAFLLDAVRAYRSARLALGTGGLLAHDLAVP
jgi:hypothetical protein